MNNKVTKVTLRSILCFVIHTAHELNVLIPNMPYQILLNVKSRRNAQSYNTDVVKETET